MRTAPGWAPMLAVLAAANGGVAAPASIPPVALPRPSEVPGSLASPGAPLPPARSVRPQGVLPAQAVPPLPPPRPPDLSPAPAPAPPPIPAPGPAAGVPAPIPAVPGASSAIPLEDGYACLRLLRGGRVEARLMPAIMPAGPGCGIASPVELSGVVLDTGRVRFEPPITVGCAMGNVTAAWVREDLAPAFASTGSPLAALTGSSGYACRGRNGVVGAKLSEHGLGHAVDIGSFRRADRTAIDVREAGAPVLAEVRATACARFATVLGPGSDGFHEAHMHVDIEERRNGFAICHWDIR